MKNFNMTKADFTNKVTELFGSNCVYEADPKGHITIRTNLQWDKNQTHIVSPKDDSSKTVT